jgi:hypothetical protein
MLSRCCCSRPRLSRRIPFSAAPLGLIRGISCVACVANREARSVPSTANMCDDKQLTFCKF